MNDLSIQHDMDSLLVFLPNGKTPGLEITNSDIKFIEEACPGVLVRTFRQSFITETAPLKAKHAIINPFQKPQKPHKKRDYTYSSHWRPISLLNRWRGLYGLCLFTRARRVLKQHPHQFGFRPLRSPSHCHFALQEVTLEARFNRRGPRGGRGPRPLFTAQLDFQSAFDLALHYLIMFRAYYNNLNGKLFRVIRELYTNTSAHVRLPCGSETKTFTIRRGALQGSTGGPDLFNSFLSDLLTILQNSGHGFTINGYRVAVLADADDLILLAETPTELQHLLDIASKWATDNFMIFAPDKSFVISYNISKLPDIFQLYNQPITTFKPKDVKDPYLEIPATAYGTQYPRPCSSTKKQLG